MTQPGATAAGEPLLRVEDLVVEHRAPGGAITQAVSGVSLHLRPGETLGVVGESGCGKSSLLRAIFQLPRPTAGRVVFAGRDLTRLRGRELRAARRDMQLVAQDPTSSLNPRHTVGRIVSEPLRVWGVGDEHDRRARGDEVLAAVGLEPGRFRDRRPHELSGGQCQRVCIARAVVLEPRLLVCDEPVSALDVSIQAQILNLLEEMKQRLNLAMLFVAHDLAVVERVSDRVAVMYLGRVSEVAAPEELYVRAAHPYTVALLAAAPDLDLDEPERRSVRLAGEPGSALTPPPGCRFHPRCPVADDICAIDEPQLRPVSSCQDHLVACHHPAVIDGQGARDLRSPLGRPLTRRECQLNGGTGLA